MPDPNVPAPDDGHERLLAGMGYPPERIARIRVEGAVARALGGIDDVRHTLDAYDIGDDDRRHSVTLAVAAAGQNLVEALRRLDPGHQPQPVARAALAERVDVLERDVERLFELAADR